MSVQILSIKHIYDAIIAFYVVYGVTHRQMTFSSRWVMAHKIRIAPGLHWMVNCPALNNGHDTLRQHCTFLRATLHNGEHDSQSMMHHLCVPLAQKTNHQSIQCLKAPKCNEIKLAGIYTLGTFRLKGRLHSGEWCDGPRCRSSKFVHKNGSTPPWWLSLQLNLQASPIRLSNDACWNADPRP